MLGTKARPSGADAGKALVALHPMGRVLDAAGVLLPTARNTADLLQATPSGHSLVLVDARQTPPIFKYQAATAAFNAALNREKAETRARLGNKLKEMRVGTSVAAHDFAVKLNRCEEWLRKGYRVRFLIESRHRPPPGLFIPGAGPNHALLTNDPKRDVMRRVVEGVAEVGEMSGAPELEGGRLTFMVQANARTMAVLKAQKKGSGSGSDE